MMKARHDWLTIAMFIYVLLAVAVLTAFLVWLCSGGSQPNVYQ